MNTEQVRNDFPLLAANPHLAYLDNGATTQKPAAVLRAVEDFYEKANANPLRGLYDLSQHRSLPWWASGFPRGRPGPWFPWSVPSVGYQGTLGPRR